MEQRSGAHVALVCGLWSMIVGTLALAFSLQYFHHWWPVIPATLIGGLGSYLTISWREVITGAKQACREIWDLRPDWAFWKDIGQAWIFYSITDLTILTTGFFLMVWMSKQLSQDLTRACWTFGAAQIAFPTLWVVPAFLGKSSSKLVMESRELAKELNPIIAIRYIWAFLLMAISIVPALVCASIIEAKKLPALVRRFFILIHSERRTICLVSTATGILIGFSIGWRAGNVAIGGLTGGLVGSGLGYLSYQIVSLRWLKIKPA